MGKRLTGARRKGYRQRRRQRDDAAHPRGRQRERPLPRRRGILPPDRRNQPARQVGRRVHPNEARDDDDGADERRGDHQFGHGITADPCNHGTRLQAGDEEDHALDQIVEEIPEEYALQTRRGADQPKPVPAHVEPRRDGRQHSGPAELLRRPIGEERRQDRKRDFDARVADPAPQSQHQPTDPDSPQDFTCNDDDERRHGLLEGKYADTHRSHREAIEHERGRVVRQPFAFQNDEELPRNPQPARDGERRHRVGRRHDGAENKSHWPCETQHIVGRRRRRGGREHDAADREHRNGAKAETKLTPAHRHRGRVDDRRQQDEKHEFRGDSDRG